MSEHQAPEFPIHLDVNAREFIVAETASLLVNLGCGRFKSPLEALEAAFDAGCITFEGENSWLSEVFDRDQLGYIKGYELQLKFVQAVEVLLLDESCLRHALAAFPRLAPEKIALVRKFIEEDSL
jgi:hypothetical protein